MSINNELYLKTLNINLPMILGGQELIFAEIVGCLKGFKSVYLPFYNHFLSEKLRKSGVQKIICSYKPYRKFPFAEGLYFGSPTIVDGKPLFNKAFFKGWDKRKERECVRTICRKAMMLDYKKIVCGLGSGDISLKERKEDIKIGTGKNPKVVCMKDFGDFKDWVLEVNLE